MAAADALPSGSILWFVDSTAPFIASDGAHLLVPDPICCGQPWQISLLSYTPDAADRRRAQSSTQREQQRDDADPSQVHVIVQW